MTTPKTKNKPSLILWLITQILIAKLPVCLMFLGILYIFGVPWEYGIILALVVGNYVHNLYDSLNDEVVLYIANHVSKETE